MGCFVKLKSNDVRKNLFIIKRIIDVLRTFGFYNVFHIYKAKKQIYMLEMPKHCKPIQNKTNCVVSRFNVMYFVLMCE